MFGTLERYLLRQITTTTLVMVALGLVILLIERMLRLLDLVANPDRIFSYVGQMLVLLIPHFLGVALPAAFFFGILLTFNRLKRDNEMEVALTSGRGLHEMLRPVMAMAFVMLAIAVLNSGFLQPFARYAYRSVKFAVAHATLSAAVRDGTFIHVSGMTFLAENAQIGEDGLYLSKIFVYEEKPDGSAFMTTGKQGLLRQGEDDSGSILSLLDGMRAEIRPDGSGAGIVSFAGFDWPIIDSGDGRFRTRGRDERELTLPELWYALLNPPPRPRPAEIRGEFHGRLVLIVSMLLLPLLAVPLALGGGPRRQTFSIILGLLVLIVYQKLLTFGEAMTSRNMASPWLALWGPFAVFLVGGLLLFRQVAFRVPDDRFAQWLSSLEDLIARVFRDRDREGGAA